MAIIDVPGSVSTIQQAINNAVPGDTVRIARSYPGNEAINLPSKSNPNNLYITIRTDDAGLANLQPSPSLGATGRRVKPSDAQFMAKIIASPAGANADGGSLILGYNTTHNLAGAVSYYQFIGIEIATPASSTINSSGFPYALVRIMGSLLGSDNDSSTLGEVPHHIVFDSCYIHAQDHDEVAMGIQFTEGGPFWVQNCYISNFKCSGSRESHGIWVLTGPGPVTVVNSYIEAAAQVFFMGGAPSNLQTDIGTVCVPSVTMTGCTLAKDPRWSQASATAQGVTYLPPSGTGGGSNWLTKNILELKQGNNCTFDKNLFMFGVSSSGTQNEEALVLNYTEYNSTTDINHPIPTPGTFPKQSRMQNITFSNNIIDKVGCVITLATESHNQSGFYDPATQLNNIVIKNNHATNWAWHGIQSVESNTSAVRLSNAFAGFSGVHSKLIFDHNTFLPDPVNPFLDSTSSFYMTSINNTPADTLVGPPTMVNGGLVTNNLSWEASFGFNINLNGQTFVEDAAALSLMGTWSGINATPPTFIVGSNIIYSNSSGQNWASNFPVNFNAGALVWSGNPPTLPNLVATQVMLPNMGPNGSTVTLNLYSLGGAIAGKNGAYTGTGTTSFLDPGADITKLPGSAAGTGTGLFPKSGHRRRLGIR